MSGTIWHWPGGISPSIPVHPEGRMSHQAMREESKAWLLFVSEQWIPREAAGISDADTNNELRQRRSLVQQWTSADQAFRDSYHDRASLPNSRKDYPPASKAHLTSQPSSPLVVLTPVDARHPLNRARWIKLLILLHRFEGNCGHVIGEYKLTIPIFAEPNPASPSPLGVADAPRLLYLEDADFSRIAMTRYGMVMFLIKRLHYYILDQKSLEEGLLSLVEFKVNGQIAHQMRPQPYNLIHVMPFLEGLAHSLGGLAERGADSGPRYNQPINMDAPILEILETALEECRLTQVNSTCFADNVEFYAPGYPAMEAEGRAAEYDPELLLRRLMD